MKKDWNQDRWTVRGITEETRREFVANCYRLGFPVGVVLTKILGELSDMGTLREFMEEELSIRDIMEGAKDALKDPLAGFPDLGDPFKGLPRL